jgi:histidinol-phosphate phosphatase family protein
MPSVLKPNGHDRNAVFVDRDGVLNRSRPDHVKSWDEFEFMPGALEGLAELRRMDVRVVVITNQSVVGRGLLTLGELHVLHQRMMAAVAGAGGEIENVYACPHLPDEGCRCRKPGTELFSRASSDLGVNLDESVMIGDSWSDVVAARNAGCRAILVDHTQSSEREADPPVVASFAQAVDLLASWRQERRPEC